MRRLLRIVVTVGVSAAALLLAPGSAFAYIGQRGDPHPLGMVNTVLIFVGGPLLAFLILALLCLRPQKGTGSARYRPGRPWPYQQTWFGTRAPVVDDEAPAPSGVGGASGSW